MEDYQKALKKLTLFPLSNSVLLMDKVIKYKRGLKLVSSRSSGHKIIPKKLLYSLYII